MESSNIHDSDCHVTPWTTAQPGSIVSAYDQQRSIFWIAVANTRTIDRVDPSADPGSNESNFQVSVNGLVNALTVDSVTGDVYWGGDSKGADGIGVVRNNFAHTQISAPLREVGDNLEAIHSLGYDPRTGDIFWTAYPSPIVSAIDPVMGRGRLSSNGNFERGDQWVQHGDYIDRIVILPLRTSEHPAGTIFWLEWNRLHWASLPKEPNGNQLPTDPINSISTVSGARVSDVAIIRNDPSNPDDFLAYFSESRSIDVGWYYAATQQKGMDTLSFGCPFFPYQRVLAAVAIDVDLCPADPYKTDPGVCSCGTPDTIVNGVVVCNMGSDSNGNNIPDRMDPTVPSDETVTPDSELLTPLAAVSPKKVTIYMQRFGHVLLPPGVSGVKKGLSFRYVMSLKKRGDHSRSIKVCRRNRITLDKLKPGNYRVKYRVEILRGQKVVKKTSFSPANSFTI